MSLPVGIDLILEAATLAASGDNTQPWTFRVDESARTLTFEVDPGRDPSPMNVGQRMSRIALGAAIENAVIQGRESGVLLGEPEVAADGHSARLSWDHPADLAASGIAPLLARRVTNRRDFEPRAVPEEVLASLSRATPEGDRVRTVWISGRDRLTAIGEVVGRADALMFGEPTMRAAFFANIRFDARPTDPVEEGLSTGSLELKPSERVLLPILKRLPDPLVKLGGAPSAFAARARQVVSGSSGVCLTAASGRSPATDVRVGRAMERSWLAMNGEGLAVQPMMSLMVLGNALEFGDARLIASLGRERAERVLTDFASLVPELGGDRPAFLCRFGYAPEPTSRTGRLPWRSRCSPAPRAEPAPVG